MWGSCCCFSNWFFRNKHNQRTHTHAQSECWYVKLLTELTKACGTLEAYSWTLPSGRGRGIRRCKRDVNANVILQGQMSHNCKFPANSRAVQLEKTNTGLPSRSHPRPDSTVTILFTVAVTVIIPAQSEQGRERRTTTRAKSNAQINRLMTPKATTRRKKLLEIAISCTGQGGTESARVTARVNEGGRSQLSQKRVRQAKLRRVKSVLR